MGDVLSSATFWTAVGSIAAVVSGVVAVLAIVGSRRRSRREPTPTAQPLQSDTEAARRHLLAELIVMRPRAVGQLVADGASNTPNGEQIASQRVAEGRAAYERAQPLILSQLELFSREAQQGLDVISTKIREEELAYAAALIDPDTTYIGSPFEIADSVDQYFDEAIGDLQRALA